MQHASQELHCPCAAAAAYSWATQAELSCICNLKQEITKRNSYSCPACFLRQRFSLVQVSQPTCAQARQDSVGPLQTEADIGVVQDSKPTDEQPPSQDNVKPGPSGPPEGDMVESVPFCGPPTCIVYGPEQGPQQPIIVCGPHDPPSGFVTQLPTVDDLAAGDSHSDI